MPPSTGCISLGSPSGTSFPIDRVIEYVVIDPIAHTCRIWADVFLFNNTAQDVELLVLHRGSLMGRNVTAESWVHPRSAASQTGTLANQITRLHRDFDPILHADGLIKVAGTSYDPWHQPDGPLVAVVGQVPERDVPFTMWQLGAFPPNKRHVFRIELEMTQQTYQTQIGDATSFDAYGDEILLHEISEDLGKYHERDVDDYRLGLENLRVHFLPEIFEWLLIAPDGQHDLWLTTPLSYNFSPRLVPPELAASTHWFVADYSQKGAWKLRGRDSNAFALKVEHCLVAANH